VLGDRGADLVAGRDAAGWTNINLWLAAVALGGDLSAADIGDIAGGCRAVGRVEWNVLAAAVNDGCADRGVAPPLRYWA
jgi:hypothetical protein